MAKARGFYGKFDNITSIGRHAFLACRKLKSIEIPESVLFIDDGAFQRCKKIKSIKMIKNNNLTSLNIKKK